MRRWWRWWTRCRKRDHEWEPAGVLWNQWQGDTVIREECVNCPAVLETEVE